MYRLHYRIKILIILYSILASCCTTRYDGPRKSDVFLEDLVDRFITTCDSHGLSCSTKERPQIVFGNMPDKTAVGTCQAIGVMGIYIMPLIIVSFVDALNLSEEEVKQIVYHELIHCYFFIDHNEGPAPHIMRTYTLTLSEIREAGGVEKLLNDFFYEYKSNKNLFKTL